MARRPARSRSGARGWPPATTCEGAQEDKFDDGWLRTGDIASVDESASVQITDRSKDVIKSGGEWISSVELENELMSHPDVIEAAVIAKPDERWSERPLCCVVLREGATVTRARNSSSTCAAGSRNGGCRTSSRSSTPCPKTSVGKFDKKVLRAQARRRGARAPAASR